MCGVLAVVDSAGEVRRVSVIEAIAVAFGIICVALTVRENVWCWPTGLCSVTLYVWIFFGAKLYSDMGLHVVYVIVSIYGWHNWLHGGQSGGELRVSRLSGGQRIAWALVGTLATAALGAAMARWTDAALPYWDATTTAFSLVAQWLMAKKKIDNWYFWIFVDVIAAGVYIVKQLYLTAGLYVVYLALCVAGVIRWRRSLQGALQFVAPADAESTVLVSR